MWALQPDALLQQGVPDCSLAQPQALLPACKSVQQHRGIGGGHQKSLGLHTRVFGHHKPCTSLPHASICAPGAVSEGRSFHRLAKDCTRALRCLEHLGLQRSTLHPLQVG